MAWVIPVAGAVISAFGNYSQGRAAKKMGERRKIAAEYESAQLEQGAGQAIAVSQRAALEENRRARLVASRALALSGASGAGASDTTIQKMMADLAGEGSYRASVALYQGEERARLMRMGAQGKSYEGEMALQGGKDQQKAYNLMAVGNLVQAGGSLYSAYGGKGPDKKLDLAGSDDYTTYSGGRPYGENEYTSPARTAGYR